MTRHLVAFVKTANGWQCRAYVEAHEGESRTEALARIVRRIAAPDNPPSPAQQAVTARGNRAA